MKRLVPISVVLLTVLLLGVAPLAANAQAGAVSIYVVQPGDTAYSIATRNCMTVQELTNLNGAVITNPNQLYPGMQLRVINQCGGSAGGGGNCAGWNCGGWGTGVYDHGPTAHARGTVSGNTYLVVLGDTSWSIAQRFGITVDALCRANGINPWFIWAGQRLIIPGLSGNPCPQPCQQPTCPPNCPQPTCPPNCQQPCTPTWPGYNCPPIYPTVIPLTPIPTTPTPTPLPLQPRIQIINPAANATLPPTFTVTGTAQGLPAGASIRVQAIIVVPNNNSNMMLVLAQQDVTLQSGGAQGQTTFQATLPVQVANQTPGFVLAFPTQEGQPAASVPVWFSPGTTSGITYNNFTGSQCVVVPIAGAPFYSTVGATQPSGYFPGAVTAQTTVVGTAAVQGAKLNNQYWFQLVAVPGTTAPVWAPQSSVQPTSAGCTGW